MPWSRRALLQKSASLLSLSALGLRSRSATAQAGRDLGILTPFYRSTQLQGHLFGMGLMTVPDYLVTPDIDLKYRKKSGMQREIPFVDTFTINRFLGGYREDWLRKFHLFRDGLGRRSLDYAIRRSDGSLHFRPELIRERLRPYLIAGYRPQDITIALENVPWDLATPDGGPPEEGPWGRRSPPGNLAEWAEVIRRFASDVKSYLGSAAESMHFETGVEYDEKISFDASAPEFYRYYEATDHALHSVLPSATLNPGEFTGLGVCTPAMANCVYDTAAFLAFAAQQHLTIPDVPRSLHSLLDRPAAWPSATAERAIRSYRRLPPVVPEVHQFGLLGEPWGNQGMDQAARQANWEFQVLLRLWATIKPRRLFHWGTVIPVGRTLVLNGSGFLRLILDEYLGSRAFLLAMRDNSGAARAETMALALVGGNGPAVIVSSFSPAETHVERPIFVDLPANMLDGGPRKSIRYRQSNNVYGLIRNDLVADNNLKPEFGECRLCLAAPLVMARDATRARFMLARNEPRYIAAMEQNLRWTQNGPGIVRDAAGLRVSLEPNELILIS